MSIKGIIFILLAAIGVVMNFSSRFTSTKFDISEMKIKLTALTIVIISILLLFIFGK